MYGFYDSFYFDSSSISFFSAVLVAIITFLYVYTLQNFIRCAQ